MFRPLIAWPAAALLAGLLCATTANAQMGVQHNLNLESGKLSDVLRRLADQMKLQVVFYVEDTAKQQAGPLRGRYTPEQALEALLKGSGLEYQLVDARTISVKKKATSPARSSSLAPGSAEVLLAQTDAPADKKAGNGVEEMLVEGERERPVPFSDRSVDLPRTIDDAQAYYIFNAQTIERSGATNIEDFLKNRLTMNTTAKTGSQSFGAGGDGIRGNTSSINLRGLGEDNTLVLINGRRVAGTRRNGILPAGQPDLNGIPMSAIERIEVLPASASAIYGGSAIGGVVNVVLKQGYKGGELHANYSNTWDSVAENRTLNGTFGASFEGGKTQLMLSAGYSDSTPMLLRDRRELIDRGYATIMRNNPSYIGLGAGYPLLGATPNILGVDANFAAPVNLTLKSGGALNSPLATLPAGYSATSNPATIIGGRWNLELPNVNEPNTGLLMELGNFPVTRSVMATLRRPVARWLEPYLELTYTDNSTDGNYAPYSTDGGKVAVDAASPANPFNQNILMSIPFNLSAPLTSASTTRAATIGAYLMLPREWRGQMDYTFSRSTTRSSFKSMDSRIELHLYDGTLNPVIDTLLYPLPLGTYLTSRDYSAASELSDVAVRASGPMFHLPWGAPTLAVGLEHRESASLNAPQVQTFPLRPTNDVITTYFPQTQSTDSAYLEATLPLVTKQNARPFVRLLDAQVAGRHERYTVDAGTTGQNFFPNRAAGATNPTYIGTTLNGAPYRFESAYSATNNTFGLRYKPVDALMLRASYATAFLPPQYSQLLPSPLPNTGSTTVTDPRTNLPTPGVQTISGGNPHLKPQNSKSWSGGVIWEPGWISGLRANLEYYRIDQFDKIASLGAQAIVNSEALFPERVTRNSAGRITFVDTSLLNLTLYESAGMDLSLDYRRKLPLGTLDLHFTGTRMTYERRQNAFNAPLLDYVGFPNSTGSARNKAYLTLMWEHAGSSVGWTTHYFGGYFQRGAPGDPQGSSAPTILAQGSNQIDGQYYHDAFVSYTFDKHNSGRGWSSLLGNLRVQAVVRNVFNTLPPFDASSAPYYYSYFGSIRMRDYTLSFTKGF